MRRARRAPQHDGKDALGGAFPGGGPRQVPIDPNGNLATKAEGTDNWAYSWNAENQLVKVEKNEAEVARFAYDPLGRRVEKVVAGGVTTTLRLRGPGHLAGDPGRDDAQVRARPGGGRTTGRGRRDCALLFSTPTALGAS